MLLENLDYVIAPFTYTVIIDADNYEVIREGAFVHVRNKLGKYEVIDLSPNQNRFRIVLKKPKN